MTLHYSGCDTLLIMMCGLDHQAFREILNLFRLEYYRYNPYSIDGNFEHAKRKECTDRPCSFNTTQFLGLLLPWTQKRGQKSMLCTLFGVLNAGYCFLGYQGEYSFEFLALIPTQWSACHLKTKYHRLGNP